jgi:isopenicillin-N N-acyltransferase like protein
MRTDQNFPVITYSTNKSNHENGLMHGETFKKGIRELAEIRKDLLLKKNPMLKPYIKDLALEQLSCSRKYSPEITDELEGIAKGAGLTIEEIVLLNNYTDFRDINLEDEGCSTIQIITKENSISGQTWDMHSSAKKYVCLINIPGTEDTPGQIYFSLVGCLGMMGINTKNLLVGVNNLNTINAHASLIWPILIRKSLKDSKNYDELEKIISSAPVTSGHNYLISSPEKGSMWEVSPEISEKVSFTQSPQSNYVYHTNHCLGTKSSLIENPTSVSSTTHSRYEILKNRVPHIKTSEDMKELLHGHENYPKSICGHFKNNSDDPSATCGGGYMNFTKNEIFFWRGCSKYDDNYKSLNFKIDGNSFKKINNEKE